MSEYKIIGLMSGTSLDGLDIVYTTLTKTNEKSWDYVLHKTATVPFSDALVAQLHNATSLSASQFVTLDYELACFFATGVNDFLRKHNLTENDVDVIASHGQTIFHQPSKGFTTQIGNPAVISFKTGIPTVGDFRTKDVLYGGQGAPLVPIGDQYLFGGLADAFLNIGGFANVSFIENADIKAFDICPGNLPLNKLARAKGLDYDRNGELARSGEISYFLLDLLNSLDFYTQDGPKSLGVEWLENEFYPLLKFDKDIENNLATVVEHIVDKIATCLNDKKIQRVMITGGGAKNSFLIERLKRYFKGEIVNVENELIEYKEALIFALLGALFLENDTNCLASVTGASQDVCSGVLHNP
jgi:anhydro-N-acetylmuramic acid kinase